MYFQLKKPVSFNVATKQAVGTLLLDPVVQAAVEITVGVLVVVSELVPSEYLTAHVTEHVPVKSENRFQRGTIS